jgi:hypothetical protein
MKDCPTFTIVKKVYVAGCLKKPVPGSTDEFHTFKMNKLVRDRDAMIFSYYSKLWKGTNFVVEGPD